jgi:hypothetical protein
MQLKITFISCCLSACLFAACSGHNSADDNAHSTPIDSTSLNGEAPATYGADNPANVQDTVYRNSNDTATNQSAVPDNNPATRKTNDGKNY